MYEKDRDINEAHEIVHCHCYLSMRQACMVSMLLLLIVLSALYYINPTAYFGALSVIMYALVYTPLKARHGGIRRTSEPSVYAWL